MVTKSPPAKPKNRSGPRCTLGILNGKLHLPADYDAPLTEDALATFEDEWASEADQKGYKNL